MDLGQVVLQHGTPHLQSSFLHIVTNSIHCFWQKDEVTGHSKLARVQCSECEEPLTLSHLSSCIKSTATAFRQHLQADIVRLLSCLDFASEWVDRHRGDPLPLMLINLFPQSPPTARHLTQVMCGAFTHTQGNQAVRMLGCSSDDEKAVGEKMVQQNLRLLCLDHLSQC